MLAVLTEGEAHGYKIMRRIEEVTRGSWRPAPGSLYPLLSYLEGEGLITCSGGDGGKKVCRLTDDGLRYFVDLALARLRVLGGLLAALLSSVCRVSSTAGRCSEAVKVVEEVTELLRRAAEMCRNEA